MIQILYIIQVYCIFKKNVILQFFYIFYFLIPVLCSSNMIVILDGLDSELKDNVYKQLSSIDFNVTDIDYNFKEKLDNLIKSGLKPLGYYNPIINIDYDLNNTINKHDTKLIIKVDPGKPIKVIEINIHIFGDGFFDTDYQKIIEDSKIFIGKKLNHNDYEELKNKVYNLAIAKGYFDSKFQKSQLIVIPSLYQSIWNIDFNSGKRYVFEEIKFQGSQIKLNYLKNICNIRLGEYYDSKCVLELNKRFSSTNWFESILTSSDFIGCSQKKN